MMTPMRRGLKRKSSSMIWNPRSGFNDDPDAKGTETSANVRNRNRFGGFNDDPDAKGTETLGNALPRRLHARDSMMTPMRRGLKHCSVNASGVGPAGFNDDPD